MTAAKETNSPLASEQPDSNQQRVYDLPGAVRCVVGWGMKDVTEWTLRRLVSSGQLKAIRLGRRIYVSRQALEEMLIRLERRAG